MKKTRFLIGVLLVLAVAFCFSEAKAQTESPWVLKLTRNFGYGSGSDIQGNMSLYLDGEMGSVARVVFYMDDEVMTEVTQEPFKIAFTTDNYQPGVHKMKADVITTDGNVTPAGPIVYNFLSAADSGKSITRILVLVAGISLAAGGISWFISSRQKGGAVVTGGMHGLAVCNRCGKTFPRSFFGMNLVVGKFERCPHCGKWQITRRASPLEIEWANEQTRPEEAQVIPEKPEKDNLDESRFVDL